MPEATYGKCTRWLTVIVIEKEAFGVEAHAPAAGLSNRKAPHRPLRLCGRQSAAGAHCRRKCKRVLVFQRPLPSFRDLDQG
jgi:hypothetical protein